MKLSLPFSDNEVAQNKLEDIYRTNYHSMIATAMRILHDESTAQDIVHQSILRFIDHMDLIDINNPLITKSYLCSMVKNLAIDFIRGDKKKPICDIDEVEFTLVDPSPSPVEIVISNDGYDYLIQCINSMSDTYRTIFHLKYINGLTEAKIAEVLGLSAKAVSLRIVRGKQILRKMIMESGYYEKR